MSLIRRKMRLRPNQGLTDKIKPYVEDKIYEDDDKEHWYVVTYSGGSDGQLSVWDDLQLYEARMGHINPTEHPSYVYEHYVMTEDEIESWTTWSGTDPDEPEV